MSVSDERKFDFEHIDFNPVEKPDFIAFSKITEQIVEQRDEFVIRTILPFCNEIVEGHLSKQDLVFAMNLFVAFKRKELNISAFMKKMCDEVPMFIKWETMYLVMTKDSKFHICKMYDACSLLDEKERKISFNDIEMWMILEVGNI